jgi:hypothetical protein
MLNVIMLSVVMPNVVASLILGYHLHETQENNIHSEPNHKKLFMPVIYAVSKKLESFSSLV